MSKRARTNLERAFEACTALTPEEMLSLDNFLRGWRLAKGLPPQQSTLPLRKRATKKLEETKAGA